MPVRLQFVSRREPAGLLDLPWRTALGEWDLPTIVRMVKGVSRHTVRFVTDQDRLYALKELPQTTARGEYGMLRSLEAERLPAVEAVGLVTERDTVSGEPLDAVLITRFLDYALPYRYLFGVEAGPALGRRLVDAAAVLLARLHLEGFYWGDCSLSNLLFRRDAGALMAYLVDAETTERHEPLPEGMRLSDLAIAVENVGGGLLELQAMGRLSVEEDAAEIASLLERRYTALWEELTAASEIDPDERHMIEARVRRLNELGFDVSELIVERDAEGARLHVRPAVVEEGHHAREFRHLTGLDVQENQARRLLNDIAGYGAYLAATDGTQVAMVVAAARWLTEIYEPVVSAIPPELRGRLEPPELFHEFLEHRYYLAEAMGHEADNETAVASYVDTVLRFRPDERFLITDE